MLKYLIVAFVFLCVVSGSLLPNDVPKDKRLARWVEYYKDVAKGFDVRLKSAPNERLSVSVEPILAYSNPTIGFDTHGGLFVWTRNVRAEAIGAIWSKQMVSGMTNLKNVNHEFHSLAPEPLIAKGGDGVNWTPDQAGIEFRPILNVPPPATSLTRRLSQMREYSRQFIGFDLNPRELGGSEEVQREMRLLPAPLYRYAEVATLDNRNATADGAIFGLFYDWDPGILLVIESQPNANGPRWHDGVAYLDYKPLRLQYKQKDIWEKPEKNFGGAGSKYYCVIGVTTRPLELD